MKLKQIGKIFILTAAITAMTAQLIACGGADRDATAPSQSVSNSPSADNESIDDKNETLRKQRQQLTQFWPQTLKYS